MASCDWLASSVSIRMTGSENSPGVLRRITSMPTVRCVADQRDGDQRAEAGAPQGVADRGVARPQSRLPGLGPAAPAPSLRGLPDDRGVVGARRGGLDRRQQLVGHQVGGPQDELAAGVVELVDGAAVGVREAGGVRDDGGEHFLEVQRGGDGLADLAERLELLDGAGELGRALLQLLEQAGVLDGDDGLVRERLQEGDLWLGEQAGLRLDHDHRADGDAFPHQW